MVSFKKNPHKSPKIRIFEKIRTCTDKSVWVGTLVEAKSKCLCIQQGHHFISVMVWWLWEGALVSYEGATSINFCEQGVKMSAMVYIDAVLEPVVEPLTSTLFDNHNWIRAQWCGKYELYPKMFEIKVVEHKISYKKVSRSICLSPPGVELGNSEE